MTSRLLGAPWWGLLGRRWGRVGVEPCPRVACRRKGGEEREEKEKKAKRHKVSLAPLPPNMLPWPCTPPGGEKDPRGPRTGRKACPRRIVVGGPGVLEGLLVQVGAVAGVSEGVVWVTGQRERE